MKSVSTTVEPKAPVSPQAISDVLREQLMAALGGDYDVSLAMTHVNLGTSLVAASNESAADISVSLRVSGMTRTEYVAQMNIVFEAWAKDEAAAITPDGYRIYITAVDNTDLTGI